MTNHIFNLPDLGEGLPDAEINEWYIKVGDEVTIDQPLVSVETAKAIVDVPSPTTGKVIKLYGQRGDIIKTGSPLIEFEEAGKAEQACTAADTGTVVGHIESSNHIVEEKFTIGSNASTSSDTRAIKVTPAVRALAKKLNVDLNQIKPSHAGGAISTEDVLRHHETLDKPQQPQSSKQQTLPGSVSEVLHGARRSMAHIMQQSHASVVPVSLFDEINVSHWTGSSDITVQLIRALVAACQKEPALNAWFDEKTTSRQLHQTINLGLAVDTTEGLFVPVIKDVAKKTDVELRQTIDTLKVQMATREFSPELLHGATITLSNFGKFAGRFATPIVVPPTVAIVGIGKLFEAVRLINNKAQSVTMLPVSLTFDHRALTGGEATRFLGAFMEALQDASNKK